MDKAYRHDKEASNIWNEYDQVRLRNARNGDHDFWNLPEMKNIAARGHAAENRSSHEYNVATEFYNKAKAKDYPLRDKVSYIKTGGTLKVPKTNPEYMRYTFDTGSAWYEKNKHLFI